MTYSDFKKIYIPISNIYFPQAPYEGTLFSPQDVTLISGNLRYKKVWSLMETSTIIDVIENKTKEDFKVVPGIQPGAKGYFVTSIPYDKTFLIVNNVPDIDF